MMMRFYDEGEPDASQSDTMVIAFGGLQQRIGGGANGGLPPWEFVRSCKRAGARRALFVRDPTRCWYCRGLGDGQLGNHGPSHTFEEMVAVLAEEVARVRPRRLVTVGSSMGGYASVRAGLLLGADVAVAFSPQVVLELSARRAAGLPPVPIDDNLKWLGLVAACTGVECTSLVHAVQCAPTTCRTRICLLYTSPSPRDS